MGKNDALAQGARKANFAVGTAKADDAIQINPGVLAPEGSFEEYIPQVEKAAKPRKVFVPLKGVLLVRRTEVKTESNLIIDSAEQEKPSEGTVLAVGPETTPLSVGDTIVFGKYAGAEFPLNGETLLLMTLEEVKGILLDEPAEKFN